MLCSVLSIGPPTLSSASRNISLREEHSDTFSFNVTEGNPRSTLTITGPSQPGNTRVSISSDGVVAMNMVQQGDAGTHVATWNNSVGDAATFTLYLTVESKLVHTFTWYLQHFLASYLCVLLYFTKLMQCTECMFEFKLRMCGMHI